MANRESPWVINRVEDTVFVKSLPDGHHCYMSTNGYEMEETTEWEVLPEHMGNKLNILISNEKLDNDSMVSERFKAYLYFVNL
jgi:hypothetical protein